MILQSLRDLEDDTILGKSIYQENGKLLLGAGFRITSPIKDKLTQRGYSHVYIMEEGTEDVVPEDIISDEIRHHARARLANKIGEIRSQKEFQDVSHDRAVKLLEDGYMKKVNISYDLKKIVEEILKDISSVGAKYMNSVMIKSKDSYFLDHALNVTTLSIILGRKYRFDHKELMNLALGAFLHDIGKVVIEQLKDSGNSGRAKQLYREHPTFGYLLLSNSTDITPMETQIVNQHHEHQDGSGFPIGLAGQNLPPIKTVVRETKGHIFRMAEICCIANTFDNMVFNPNDKNQKAPDQAIKQIILDSEKMYNADVVQTLLKVVPYFPVGARIKVMDIVDPHLIGYRGVVAKINDENINKPVIILTKNKFLKKIKPIVIDTSKFKHVDLKLIV